MVTKEDNECTVEQQKPDRFVFGARTGHPESETEGASGTTKWTLVQQTETFFETLTTDFFYRLAR